MSSIPLDGLKKLGLETGILVVDNASEDNTANEAEEAGARVVLEERYETLSFKYVLSERASSKT